MNKNEKKLLRKEQIAKGLDDPAIAFNTQRCNAKKRGIAWNLSFDEWWGIWRDFYHMRGRGTNGLVMARENDSGPYEIGNVYLTTNLGNLQEYHSSDAARRVRDQLRAKNYENTPRPVWAKAFHGDASSGLTKAKNHWNGAEAQKDNESS